jgi:hypothetical protein
VQTSQLVRSAAFSSVHLEQYLALQEGWMWETLPSNTLSAHQPSTLVSDMSLAAETGSN